VPEVTSLQPKSISADYFMEERKPKKHGLERDRDHGPFRVGQDTAQGLKCRISECAAHSDIHSSA
jgi:hypothetical protein